METRWLQHTLLLFSVLLLFSCKSVKLPKAEEKHRIGAYYEAADMYCQVYAGTSPRERELRGYIAYRMGDCNRILNYTARAVSAYMNAARYNYPDSTIWLRLGQMYQKSGNYQEAITYYTRYLGVAPANIFALAGIKGCELAQEWKANPTRYEVRRMEKFNSNRGEFGPVLGGRNFDQLYFASSRIWNKEIKPSPVTGQVNNNIFVVRQNENGDWLTPVRLKDPVNTEFDEGTPSFSPDGNTMYYTYCASDPEKQRTAEIYISRRSDAQWGKGTRAAIGKDPETMTAHPAVSPDGKWLYFVSDAETGYGGKDIYRAKILGDEFGPAENLGPEINTPGDELFPYVRDSVTLYFASDGHPGMGGLDIFKATQDSTGRWIVENMKSPVNSMADDFGITFAGKAEKGFFSSNRNDVRGFDHIYSFEYPAVTTLLEGFVFDVEEYPVGNAAVLMVGSDGLNIKVPVRKDGSYRVPVERGVKYVMMAGAAGYLNQHFELRTEEEEKNETYIVDFVLTPVQKPVVIDNIFYDFDKAALRPESKEALDDLVKMLDDNPYVTIELAAHTDRKGTEVYNLRLALRRAQSVVDYLIGKGINKDRLEAKGYGGDMPQTVTKRIAAEYAFLEEGDILTEEFVLALPPEQQEIADQVNRRMEFKVLRVDYNLF